MDMSPGATNQPTGQKEFTLSQNRISTLLSAPSTNSNSGSRPGETRFRAIENAYEFGFFCQSKFVRDQKKSR